MTARLRTGYSFRSAVGRVDDVISRLIEIGSPYAPITDTASTFGWVKWSKAAKKAGLRPVYGVELAVSPDPEAKKPIVDYWTFIAKDSLKPIHELIAEATRQFRYQPLLTIDQAASRSDVFSIVGYRTNPTTIAPREGLYVGLGPSSTRGGTNRALDAGHRLIAVSDNRYPRVGQEGFYETVAGRNTSLQSYPQWIMSDEGWFSHVTQITGQGDARAALSYRDDVLENSTAALQPRWSTHRVR
jgi:hypothetical protein